MFNIYSKLFISLFLFVSFLEASTDKLNQQIFELKTSQEFAQKLNDEKNILIMGEIIQKENEIKELKNELEKYIKKEDIEKEISHQNNRIEDINSSVDRLSIIVSISIGFFGVLITGIVIFFAFRFEKIAISLAEEEAIKSVEKEAPIQIKKWIEKKADSEFKPKVDEYLNQINMNFNKLFNDEKDKHNKVREDIKNKLNEDIKKHGILPLQSDIKENEIKNDIIKTYDNNIHESEKTNDSRKIIEALFKKASLYNLLSKYEESLAIYDEVVNRFEDSAENNILESVAKALYNKGGTLGTLNRSEEEIEVYDEVVKRFEDSKESNILESVASALYNKGATLGTLNKSEEAIEVYDEVIRRFEDSKESNTLEQVASALYNKGATLGTLNKREEAIEVYDEVIRRFEDSKENNILERVAKALYNKGGTLGILNKSEEAIEVYDEVIRRFEDSKESNILEVVASAVVNKIETKLITNKLNSQKDLDLCFKLVENNKEELIKFEILKILENAIIEEQEEKLKLWQNQFKDMMINNWSFSELKTWANLFEEKDIKNRLLEYIDIFENHNKNDNK